MIRRILATLAIAACLPTDAAFHLWTMEELYSNVDGTVQYLELRSLQGGQQFVGQHELSSTSGGQARVFTFPGNLPGDSGNRRMLIATEGFVALGVVTPDFVVPNGFFGSGAGRIDFAGGSDVWNHPAPPTDGSLSLNRDGSAATNTPRNFAGNTATITPQAQPAFNFQGLWYADPPESEAGWGLGIAHQGNILFVTWFTYDADGSQMWLVMSSATRVAANRYEGQVFRTVGPPFNTTPWDRTRVVASPVGTGTLAFTNADRGTFSYAVNGVVQTKDIVKQVFSTPVSSCSAGGTPGAANFQDLWWGGESESGWGINITHQGDILFAAWFTYDANGRGQYIVMSAGRRTGPGVYTGDLYRTSGPAFSAQPWDPRGVTVTRVGSGTFTFTSNDSGTFQYSLGGVAQAKAITRQAFSTPVTICR